MSTPNTLPTKRMAQLSIKWSRQGMHDTKKDRHIAIRALRDSLGRGLGGLSLEDARGAVERVAEHIIQRRAEKLRTHRWYAESRSLRCESSEPVQLPVGTPQQRLDAKRRAAVNRSISTSLRRYEREDAPVIRWVDALTDCAIGLSREEGWVQYSKSYGRRYGILSATYTVEALPKIPVPREIGGLLTLGAMRATSLEHSEHEHVYRAVWARQTTDGPMKENGYIVSTTDRHGNAEYAHGRSVGAARGSLTRRLGTSQRLDVDGWKRLQKWQTAVRRKLEAGNINGYDVPVTIADARRTGLCDPGVRSWCARHGIDPDTGSTVSNVLAIDDQRSDAMAACMSAIRARVVIGEAE